jgi:hypothetical protein
MAERMFPKRVMVSVSGREMEGEVSVSWGEYPAFKFSFF